MLSMREAVYNAGNSTSYIMETFSTTSPHVTYRRPQRSLWEDEDENVTGTE